MIEKFVNEFFEEKYEFNEEEIPENKGYNLLKKITYPILGALPIDVRYKLQYNNLIRKYGLNLEKAADASTVIESLTIAIGVPIASAILFPGSAAFALFGSVFSGLLYMNYRFNGSDNHPVTRGSLLTEIPYKIYKSIKKFSDYINDKEVIKNERHNY